MPAWVDITNKEKLSSLLSKLSPDTLLLWGRLKAQNMIEHLIEAVEHTNGKRTAILKVTDEEAAREKKSKVTPEFEIPPNVRGPLPDNSGYKRFSDLPTAINELKKEIEAFKLSFDAKDKTATHGAFGPMNYEEWLLWHGKHFGHHFKQFGILGNESIS